MDGVDLNLWAMDSSNPEQFDAAWHHNQEVLDAMNLRDVQLAHNAEQTADARRFTEQQIRIANEFPVSGNDGDPASNADAENIPIATSSNSIALWCQVHDSTNIAGWHWFEGKLTVQFVTGTTYQYSGVPLAVAEDWLHADSFGVYFTTVIKKAGYRYERV